MNITGNEVRSVHAAAPGVLSSRAGAGYRSDITNDDIPVVDPRLALGWGRHHPVSSNTTRTVDKVDRHTDDNGISAFESDVKVDSEVDRNIKVMRKRGMNLTPLMNSLTPKK